MITKVAAFGALIVGGAVLAAEGPSWWLRRSVIDPDKAKNNHGVANLGQAKWMAAQAYEEFEVTLFGGYDPSSLPAGHEDPITPDTWDDTGNHVPVNLGQVKRLAEPFWLQLYNISPAAQAYTLSVMTTEHGYDSSWAHPYPWNPPGTGGVDNKSAVNIGQLKMAFTFHLRRDADGDGLVDYQELQLGGTTTSIKPEDDADNDGFSNIEEAMAGTDARPGTGGSDFPKPTDAQLEVFTPNE